MSSDKIVVSTISKDIVRRQMRVDNTIILFIILGESCAARIIAINKTKEQVSGILGDAILHNNLKLVRALHTYKGVDFEHKDEYGNVILFKPLVCSKAVNV